MTPFPKSQAVGCTFVAFPPAFNVRLLKEIALHIEPCIPVEEFIHSFIYKTIMMYYLSPFSGLSGLRLLVLFYVMLSGLPYLGPKLGLQHPKWFYTHVLNLSWDGWKGCVYFQKELRLLMWWPRTPRLELEALRLLKN